MSDEKLRDCFRGVIIGAMIGDALGAPVEGMSPAMIASRYGRVTKYITARLGPGTITDDGQMTIALAEALLATPGRTDREIVAKSFAKYFDPARGYGGNTTRILSRIQNGESVQLVLDEESLPGGSYGNGAAMRVGPAACAFFGDEAAMLNAVREQSAASAHHHPEAVGGAAIVASTVHDLLLGAKAGDGPGRKQIIENLLKMNETHYQNKLEWIADNLDASPVEALDRLGSDVRALNSVPLALWSFLHNYDDPNKTITCAINLGGDADTVGSMAGAMAGAKFGVSAFRSSWYDGLENGPAERDYGLGLADRLYEQALGKK